MMLIMIAVIILIIITLMVNGQEETAGMIQGFSSTCYQLTTCYSGITPELTSPHITVYCYFSGFGFLGKLGTGITVVSSHTLHVI